jgi:DNA-binding transcriptional LysR family regulator
MLDVRRMRVLREVAQRGSFSAAAEALSFTQSAVSQHVAALEREVGMRLLERGRSGPKLTDAGRSLVAHTDAVLCRLDEAERDLAAIAGLEGGELRLASFPSASATLVTEAVAAFVERYPKVAMAVVEAEPEESLPMLAAGDLDIAIVFDYPDFPADTAQADLDLVPLLTESMYVALPEAHKLSGAESIRIADLAEDAWLCGVGPSSCSDVVKSVCREAGFQPRIAFESDDYNVLQGYVAAGLGVTLLPDLAMHALREGVAIRPVRPQAPQRRVWAAAREAGVRSVATDAMLEELQQVGEGVTARSELRAVA